MYINKVAIHTSMLGPVQSGGIRCIVYLLNLLKERDYTVCAFVDAPPYNSTWLDSKFDVIPSNSEDYNRYDGILISPYTPTMRRVAEHKNAKCKIIWMHTAEFAFEHSGKEFTKEAIECCKLKNVYYMATSNYVTTFLNLIFKQSVLPHRVHGGVDPRIFKFDDAIFDEKMKLKSIKFCMLNRPEPLRGINIGLQAFELLKKEFGSMVELELFANVPQDEMYKHYGSAHFFIDPSLVAGWSIPPVESMICGTIPITTIFGSMDYIKDWHNGFFINSGDVKHTYQVMKNCVELFLDQTSPTHKFVDCGLNRGVLWYETMVEEARKTAEQLTWEHMVDNFEKNLHSIF